MNSLYLENSIIGSLFRFFSPYFSTATRPTRFLLTWLVIAQVALQSFLFTGISCPRVPSLLEQFEQLLLGDSERNGDELFFPPANSTIGLQPDSDGLTE